MSHCGVSRLKYTLARVAKADILKLKDLETLMSMESSYRTYRHHLTTVDLPAIPYMYVFDWNFFYVTFLVHFLFFSCILFDIIFENS
jgi:hypothetical protein